MSRRANLIDKEIDGTITEAEQVELERLQSEMLTHRRKVAPLPLDELRALHQKMLNIHINRLRQLRALYRKLLNIHDKD